MSVRGWPGLTLFNIRLSISPSGSTSLSCCKKTINRPQICHAERLTRYTARRSEQNKTCVFVLSPAKAINICAPLLSSGIYSISVLSHPCWSQLTWRHEEDRHYTAASSLMFPRATGRALFGGFCSGPGFTTSVEGFLIQWPCLSAPLTQRPSPSSAFTAIIITGAPQSVIYKS